MKISRRALLGGTVGAAAVSMLGPAGIPEVTVSDIAFAASTDIGVYNVLTLEMVMKAVAKLKACNESPHPGGYYHAVIHPRYAAQLRFQQDSNQVEADHHVESTVDAIFAHEMRRYDLHKRADYPTHAECLARVQRT